MEAEKGGVEYIAFFREVPAYRVMSLYTHGES